LKELKGLKVISPSDPKLSTGIVSVLLDKASNREIFEKMKQNNIIIKLLPKYNALRFSHHMFNTREEVDELVEKMGKILEA
jgi:selenocysteine lyase/cysteine desulfurase